MRGEMRDEIKPITYLNTMSTSSSNKRQRIFHLAKAAQAHLVYLLHLNEPPTKFSTDIMNASMGMINSAKCWGYLDFKLIQDMCGRTLTDDDIRWVLLAIDGVNTIKSLKLTHCFNITGECLESLSGSTVLERIDLSLAEDNESPYFDEDTKLSFDVVVVVLESILTQKVILSSMSSFQSRPKRLGVQWCNSWIILGILSLVVV